MILLCLGIILLLAACGTTTGQETSGNTEETSNHEVQEIRFGIPPGEANEDWQKIHEPMVKLIEEATGLPVELVLTSDYPALVEAMRAGHVELGQFSPFLSLLAMDVANGEPLAVGVPKSYTSSIVVPKDSPIQSIEELKGKSISFADPGSTSGNFVPRLLLERAGIDPDTEMKAIYAGGHDASALAVANGNVDAAAVSTRLIKQMEEEGFIDPGSLRIIATSEEIAISASVIAHPDLPEDLKEAITTAFVEDVTPEVLEILGVQEYKVPESSDYALFYEMAETLNLNLKELE